MELHVATDESILKILCILDILRHTEHSEISLILNFIKNRSKSV